ncbi:MAG TPA: glycosyltransferase family 39 protein [Flavobacteriaceae bacterium]|mgnify:CR=1 FL=1|nr:glycosyltransferase family 39 protein [Flavobacteriaceae bacterium]MCB9213537.1 glycosyltransferase family 39 protein [Alteromonas sp.]HPF10763.1 glycosyltransferase family 39 protein [Flavobacteriaceae bacterium]HQU21529.1 glycosyltransferase family 39 protein [Flavobacteriaceae bacterium]HQU65498.1 glycosyltransferase family 39 protein [Flavobacteriaceae bacterium]
MKISFLDKKYNPYLILLLLAALALRLYNLNYEGLWNDELFTADTANPSRSLGKVIDIMKFDVHPPLHNLLSNLWCRIFSFNDTSLRIFSVLWGLLAAFSLFQLAKLLFNKKVALYTLLLVVVNSYLIRYSQEVRSYSFFMALSNYSFFYFVKLMRGVPSKKTLIGYIGFTTALLYTHYYALFVYAGQGVMLLLLLPWKALKTHFKQYALSFAVPILLFSAWIPILIKQLKVPHQSWRDTPSAKMIITYFQEFFNDYLLSTISLILIVGTIFMLLFQKFTNKYSFFKPFLKHQKALWLLCGWTIFYFFFPMVQSKVSNSILVSRYFIVVLGPILILLGFYISKIPKKKNIRNGFVTSVVIYSLLVLFLNDRPYYTQSTSYREIAQDARNINPEAYVLFIGNHRRYFDYYLQQNNIRKKNGYLESFSKLLEKDQPEEYFLFLDLRLTPKNFKNTIPVVSGYHQISEKTYYNQNNIKTVKLVRYQKDKSTL